MVQRMVNAHPAIAITPESHWIPRLYAKAWALTPEGSVKPKLIRRLLGHPKFARLKISPEEIERLAGNGKPITYATLVSRIFDVYGERQGKPLVGDKTPDYVRSIETLHNLWPDARFVHVIRDATLALMLFTVSNDTLGVRLWSLWFNEGKPAQAAALAVCLALVSGLLSLGVVRTVTVRPSSV